MSFQSNVGRQAVHRRGAENAEEARRIELSSAPPPRTLRLCGESYSPYAHFKIALSARLANVPKQIIRSVPSFLVFAATSLLILLSSFSTTHAAAAKRLVILKFDGLPHDTVERFVRQRDARTGKSLLPWFEHVFYERGTRVANFYVRGASLSVPSWSLLDTGQHLQIKGNVEFDRYTLHSYDYLNFIPFWIANLGGARVDMPGPELLDEIGVPLLLDAYPYAERYTSFQLYQRGPRWTTLQRGIQNRFTSRSPGELFGEWQLGIGARGILNEQLERELIEKLNDPSIRYLDLYSSEFDYAAHHNRESAVQLAALRELDALVGRVWVAIQQTPLAADTALVVVSDHGTNTDERVYSQGYNLVKFLASAEGGGHHVVTKRRLLASYSLKGIYPLIPLIYTTTEDSFYLKGRSADYPTALVDFDGNERASIQLRDSDINLIHILLLQLKRDNLSPDVRRAATDALFSTIERRRPEWQKTFDDLKVEIGALHRLIEKLRPIVEAQPKKWTKEDRDAGRDKEAMRLFARLNSWSGDEREYAAYAQTLANLLALDRARFNPSALKIEDIIPKGAMGEHNTIHELQNYVVGPAHGGLALARDGTLDVQKSFVRVNYFELLGDVSVRNNVQTRVENRPVDFVAVRVPAGEIRAALGTDARVDEAVWLYGGRDRQALVLARDDGGLHLRYVPIKNLRQDTVGRINFDRADWREGLPLKLWEDKEIVTAAAASRAGWLEGWHTDIEWLRATHRAKYSNAVVSLHEQFARHVIEGTDFEASGLSDDERLIRSFRARQRRLVESDLLILANDHWNFDVRGFNPGGNHGSFLRVSTHSTLMLAGGDGTRIPRGLAISEPYDSLSFMPTMLALTGQIEDGTRPVPALWRQGFRAFPGRVIREIFDDADRARPLADNTKPEAKP
ncbi:MAG TPA: alkaline phosphatase family protein [Pyrinomonadaceae bacterium]|nr:alkaline phosphatase family protein [Pyrinomonadaceae bacterium]